LNVYKVDSDWCKPPCRQITWEVAAAKPPKGDPNYQLLEVCIWRAEQRIALYEFGDSFYDEAQNSYNNWCFGSWECPSVKYEREKHSLYEAKWDVDMDRPTLSNWMATKFSEILGIVQQRKARHYGLSYAGHGSSADGALFEGLILAADTKVALKPVAEQRFSLINFGGNCVEGKWDNLNVLQDFGNYVIASDLLVNGVQISDDEKMHEYMKLYAQLSPPNHMLTLLESDQPLSPRDLGARLLEGQRKLWEVAKSDIDATKLKQSLAMYDMGKFESLRSKLTEAWKSASVETQKKAKKITEESICDVRTFGQELGGSEVDDAFLALRIGYTSTADMFQWDVTTNGLGFNFLEWKAPPCDMRSLGMKEEGYSLYHTQLGPPPSLGYASMQTQRQAPWLDD
jgi:hypothetical protein